MPVATVLGAFQHMTVLLSSVLPCAGWSLPFFLLHLPSHSEEELHLLSLFKQLLLASSHRISEQGLELCRAMQFGFTKKLLPVSSLLGDDLAANSVSMCAIESAQAWRACWNYLNGGLY